MIRNYLCAMLIFFVMLAVFGVNSVAEGRGSAPGDLFYNFYVPPVGEQSVGAELYPCPRPAPPLVGWTYITYQPLMPHEFLYHHSRTYTYYHMYGGVTRTSVSWR
ncbi:MAG: hypothetical protein ABSE63_02490 [Thermoguttaceae bacterium]|jgi:hypothetical protein